MVHGQERSGQLTRIGRGRRSGRERSASPRPSTSRSNQPVRPIISVPPNKAASRLLVESLGGSHGLHPILSQVIDAYSRWVISYARAVRRGGAYIEEVGQFSDVERDEIFIEFIERLGRTDRRRRESERETGMRWRSSTRGTPGEDQWPWSKAEVDGKHAVTDSQIKTRESLEIFRKNIELATREVKYSPGAPKRFPDSEWRNTLRGEAVDLDCVLCCQYTSAAGKDQHRRVETSNDWHIAWSITVEAIVLAFPHRKQELDEYTSYMLLKFHGQNLVNQRRLICFDKAIRNAVRGGQVHSLLDRQIREQARESILLPDGIEYDSAAQRPGKICNQFNRKVGCGDYCCPYQHRCRSCKELGDHGQANCPKNWSRKIGQA